MNLITGLKSVNEDITADLENFLHPFINIVKQNIYIVLTYDQNSFLYGYVIGCGTKEEGKKELFKQHYNKIMNETDFDEEESKTFAEDLLNDGKEFWFQSD